MESFTENNIPVESGKIPLTVILIKKDDCWVALGVQIYYVAYGRTVNDAKSNFEAGLMKTFELCSAVPGALKKFIKPMPNDIFEKYKDLGDKLIDMKDDDAHDKFAFNFLKQAA